MQSRRMVIPKVKLGTAPKGKEWRQVRTELPIQPDDMDKLVRAAAAISGVRLDWRMQGSHYHTYLLCSQQKGEETTGGQKNNEMAYAAQNALEWLAPAYQRCRRQVEQDHFTFVLWEHP